MNYSELLQLVKGWSNLVSNRIIIWRLRIVSRVLELGGYENVSDSVKEDVFRFDIADVSGSIRLFSDVMKRLGIKLDGDELYEEYQRIYDERVSRDTNTEKAKDKIWDMRR